MGTTFTQGRPKAPLVVLPRAIARDADGNKPNPSVELYLEFAKGTAGCCICQRPIAAQTTRLAFKVYLHQPLTNKNGTQRHSERYYAHPGCITDRIKPEVIRFGLDCFDCGARPPEHDGMYGVHPFRCFTVSKFSYGSLCKRCIQKPKWLQCRLCHTVYPPWMIHEVAELPDSVKVETSMRHFEVETLVVPTVDPGQKCCEHCASRFGLRTVESISAAEDEFETLRKKIKNEGFWDAE